MATEYEVIGKANVHGFNPGERFHADLEPLHEARMIKGGFLRIVPQRRSFGKQLRNPPVVEEVPEEQTSEEPDKEKEE